MSSQKVKNVVDVTVILTLLMCLFAVSTAVRKTTDDTQFYSRVTRRNLITTNGYDNSWCFKGLYDFDNCPGLTVICSVSRQNHPFLIFPAVDRVQQLRRPTLISRGLQFLFAAGEFVNWASDEVRRNYSSWFVLTTLAWCFCLHVQDKLINPIIN